MIRGSKLSLCVPLQNMLSRGHPPHVICQRVKKKKVNATKRKPANVNIPEQQACAENTGGGCEREGDGDRYAAPKIDT